MKKKEFIIQDLLSKIYQNKFTVYSLLPPERELMETYSVSRNTIREAIKNLKEIGMIVSVQGRGNVVQTYNKNASLIYSSITEKKSNQIHSRVNFLRLEYATVHDRQIFDLKTKAKVWYFQRVRVIDGKVMEIQTSKLPQTIFHYIDQNDVKESIQKLVTDMDLDISHSIATMEAINLSEAEGKMLHEKKNTAAMKIISRGVLREGIVFEYTERVVVNYKGTFKLPFSKDIYNYRHQ